VLSIVDCNRMFYLLICFDIGLNACNAIIIRPIVKVEGNNRWGTFDCHLLPSCLCVKCEVWRLHVTSGVDDREVAKLLELSHFNTLRQNMTFMTNPIRLQWMASMTKKKTKCKHNR